ncbi:MAG: hypothetical protein HN855_12710 [Anaerolineae bacterium]|jgi:hypothetical protein|nr:hypothetical protein [Anaerolineae bacterium]MBT7069366.1 hypothetical protein [Anaerolineae bacterium]MBT7326015.1 hypothetical protein [Anaerolineae bacterium]MBT7602387.1 hypothetical protein [Anaerolineae bacterium]
MRKKIYLLVSLLVLVGCSKPSQAPSTDEEKLPALEATQLPTLVPLQEETKTLDITQLWSYGLTSIRTGEPIIAEGGEHQLDENLVALGYNLVVDKNGNILTPRAVPLHGGEKLILTDTYQDDHNTREYARIYTIMAPIRDTILYHFEETTKEEWLAITAVLTINNIKTQAAPEVNGRSVLSTKQVYDYVSSGNAEGSPIMRYLEEAGLELKCLAFQDFDFTNPEGANHCVEHNLAVGSGIILP